MRLNKEMRLCPLYKIWLNRNLMQDEIALDNNAKYLISSNFSFVAMERDM